ncbi:MAG: VWA domain-containing protein [Deltaproteobacteria bacterium]|nr:VWA domain-containing protein [Deltaproteobacteria bacterium]
MVGARLLASVVILTWATVAQAQECNATAPNMLLVVDLSGSMDEAVGGTPGGASKWEIVKAAVKTITDKYGSNSIRFGLELFADPDQSDYCKAAKVHIGVADDNAAAIQGRMNSEMPWSNTPLKGALDTAGGYQGLRDAARSNYVLLLTDGQETCDADSQGCVQSVTNLMANDVKTFVVGFGSSVDAAVLNAMATEGGTARPVQPFFYAVDSSAGLADAFEQIASMISAIGGPCTVAGRLGECAKGEWGCQNGYVVCTQVNFPAIESCDGLDNNCDGDVDENLTRACPTDGGTGAQICTNGAWDTCISDNDASFDSGLADSGPTDVGAGDAQTCGDDCVTDTGLQDSGSPDSGVIDGGYLDAGHPDAGHADAGVTDGGSSDNGFADAGPMDAGDEDSGSGDTGMIDIGPSDTGHSDSAIADGESADAYLDAGDGAAHLEDSAVADDGHYADVGKPDSGSLPKADAGSHPVDADATGAGDTATQDDPDEVMGGGCSCAAVEVR